MGIAKLGPAEINFFTDAAVAADPAGYFDHLLAQHPVWREPKYGVVIGGERGVPAPHRRPVPR